MSDNIEKKAFYKVKVKPVYNFQSIEIEFEAETTQEIIDYIQYDYIDVLSELKTSTDAIIKPIEPVNKKIIKQEAVELPTARQYEIMDAYGIDYDDKTTKQQAVQLIKASMKKGSE